jgi:signal transduction histidine kinase
LTDEKKKRLNGKFEPTVLVTTKRVGYKIEITVNDNGTGIPQKALDKIFHHFLRLKPRMKDWG